MLELGFRAEEDRNKVMDFIKTNIRMNRYWYDIKNPTKKKETIQIEKQDN